MILIGSKAAKYWFPDFRNQKDFDIIGTHIEYKNLIKSIEVKHIIEKPHKNIVNFIHNNQKCILEFEFDYRQSAKMLIANQSNFNQTMVFNQPIHIANQSTLYLLKRSHLYWNIHWVKSIEDYHWIKARSHIPSQFDYDFYSIRHREIYDRFSTPINKLSINLYDLQKMTRELCLQKLKIINTSNMQKTLNKLCTSNHLGYSDSIIEYYPKLSIV